MSIVVNRLDLGGLVAHVQEQGLTAQLIKVGTAIIKCQLVEIRASNGAIWVV